MKNPKDFISNICALLIVIAGALVTAIQSGVITFLPGWVSGVCVLTGVIATAIIGYLTGKPTKP